MRFSSKLGRGAASVNAKVRHKQLPNWFASLTIVGFGLRSSGVLPGNRAR
jgi:hypothetical protein